MSASADALPPDGISILHAHQSLQEAPFDPGTVKLLRATFDAVGQMAKDLCENEGERIAASNAAADAIVALAEAGLQPEHIKRLALSGVRFTLARHTPLASDVV